MPCHTSYPSRLWSFHLRKAFSQLEDESAIPGDARPCRFEPIPFILLTYNECFVQALDQCVHRQCTDMLSLQGPHTYVMAHSGS